MSDAIAKALPKINGFTLRRPNLLPVLGFISLLLLVSLFFVWSRVQVTSLEYEMSQLESFCAVAQEATESLLRPPASGIPSGSNGWLEKNWVCTCLLPSR